MLPPVRTAGKRRVVGFDTASPSSVLHDSPASSDDSRRRSEGRESPLSSALKRELSMPALNAALPALPKLKLGLGRKAMPRSKSHGNLLSSQPTEVPEAAPKQRSATSSPHAASSGGSEPVRIPFELNRRRTVSVDFTSQPGVAAAAAEEEQCQDDDIASTPVISAASSLLGHHLGGALAGATTTPGTATAAASSASGSPLFGGAGGVAFGSGCGLGPRAQSASRDLFVAQADAVMAHAQVQTLQTALRKEQDEVVRLREQLQWMTVERDRLLSELSQGDSAPVFDIEAGPGLPARPPKRGSRSGRLAPAPALSALRLR
ncbi:hypothetical protein D9Q98_000117 [Chlorella vulgaris]|uniref:Uncharacterized protein n=1 Tax=Chlorella vulgaris TaxID=3077 RepID=A0A9D4TXK7_CHLVU|nr:hypothetical protein D9Q98_000117 [Chlorella vulgaris]